MAQQHKTTLAGVYFLTGVRETASVFELKEDSSFEFFFSQGALDRGGKGKWTLEGDRIIFNTAGVRPLRDYAMVNSSAVPGDKTIIKMVDNNTMILSYSDISVTTPAGILTASTDSHGEATFAKKGVDTVELLFRLCPDRTSVFTVDPKKNYFEFRLEPWIAEIFFQNFSLHAGTDRLTGAHPLLEGKQFSYEKEKKNSK